MTNFEQEIEKLRNLSQEEISIARKALKDMQSETDEEKKKVLSVGYNSVMSKPITAIEAQRTTKLIELALMKLYYDVNDSFFAYLFFQVNRIHSANTSTMGVGLRDSNLKMFFNSRFVDILTTPELITVIKHESLHLINQHLNRGTGAKEKSKTKHTMENIAMDCAINQYLNKSHLDTIGGVTLESFRKLLKSFPPTFKLEEKQPYEYYYELLNQEKNEREKNQGEQGESDLMGEMEAMGGDDHSEFGEMDALDRALLEDKIKKAYEQAKSNGVGKVPQEVEDLISMMKKPQVNWKRQLKQFTGSTTKSDSKHTRSRRNRRYGIKVAGKKFDYTAKILVGLDTSGSMSGSRTDKVLSEIYGIWKNTPELEIDIAECDTEIKDVFKYNGKDTFKISGRGGTYLQPLLDYAKANRYDGIVLLSDGELFETLEDRGVPTLFVSAENRNYSNPFGKTIYVD